MDTGWRRVNRIRQWKYCPDCQRKLTKECGICRQLICLKCDLGIILNLNHGFIHEQCEYKQSQSLQEVTIELTKNLPYAERMKVIQTRNEWLKRQRKQDKKEIISKIRKKYLMQWENKGLCPMCSEHEIIFKAKRCLKCYGKHLKARRQERNKR